MVRRTARSFDRLRVKSNNVQWDDNMRQMMLSQLLNQLDSWAIKHKLKKTDFTISGVAALALNGLIDTDCTAVAVYAKRKVFLKITNATDSNSDVFHLSDNIRVHLNNDIYDTVLRNGYKVLSLNQIVKELQGQAGFLDLVNKAKELIEIEATTKVHSAVNVPTGIDPRKQLVKRLRKEGRFTTKKNHWPYNT